MQTMRHSITGDETGRAQCTKGAAERCGPIGAATAGSDRVAPVPSAKVAAGVSETARAARRDSAGSAGALAGAGALASRPAAGGPRESAARPTIGATVLASAGARAAGTEPRGSPDAATLNRETAG
jgi:hypothetical protein